MKTDESLIFQFTAYALEKGFGPQNLNYFAHKWYAIHNYNSTYTLYKNKCNLLSKLLFILNVFCWIYISVYITIYIYA